MSNTADCEDFWSCVEWRAEHTPASLLALDEHDRHLDFAGLRERAERVAAGLLDAGVSAGTRVAWILPTRIESMILCAALARLGCEQVPLIPAYAQRELAFIFEECRPSWIVVPGTWQGVDYVARTRTALQESEASSSMLLAAPELPQADPESLAPYVPSPRDPTRWIFYTSGTTSKPKGALHSDGTLIGSAIGLEAPHAFTALDRVSLVFPFAHIGGPSLLLSALRVGHALILSETFDPTHVIDTLSRHGVTLAGSGPAFWQAYLAAQRDRPDQRLFPSLRALIGGGAAKPAHLHAEARKILGVPIVSGYGSTECPGLAYNHVGDPEHVLATDGRAVKGVEIRITLDDGRDALPDQEGEIRVRGPMLFRGYLSVDPADQPFDERGWLRTGDLGRLDRAGQLRVTGRTKDVIIRKGENISAKEIEDVLGEHPAVSEAAVVGVPDPERGERCCAVVVATNPDRAPQLAELVLHCAAAGLMKQKHPEQLEIVDALPRNSTGKVLKAQLRERFAHA